MVNSARASKKSTSSSPKKPSTDDNLREIRERLNAQDDEINRLKRRVDTLEGTLCRTNAELVLSKHVNTILKCEIDRQDQYSRRSCLIISGVPVSANENSVKTEELARQVILENLSDDISANDFDVNLDKAHRLGRKHNIIVKFKCHSFREKVYRNRKKMRGVKFHVALTPHRSSVLNSAQEEIKDFPIANFCFADPNGNLKVKLHDQSTFPFTDTTDLRELLHSLSDDYGNFESPPDN